VDLEALANVRPPIDRGMEMGGVLDAGALSSVTRWQGRRNIEAHRELGPAHRDGPRTRELSLETEELPLFSGLAVPRPDSALLRASELDPKPLDRDFTDSIDHHRGLIRPAGPHLPLNEEVDIWSALDEAHDPTSLATRDIIIPAY
jgi:hypothetical protein